MEMAYSRKLLSIVFDSSSLEGAISWYNNNFPVSEGIRI